MHAEWLINSREKQCKSCSSSFLPGNEYMGTLSRGVGDFVRNDYCMTCWRTVESLQKQEFFSAWKGRVPEKVVVEEEPLTNVEKVEQLLRKLMQQEQAPLKACYVLAVILERKRIVKQVDTQVDAETGEKKLIFIFPKTGESLVLTDPHVSLREIPEIQRDIEGIIAEGI